MSSIRRLDLRQRTEGTCRQGGYEPRLSSAVQKRKERPKMTWHTSQREAVSLGGWCSSLHATSSSVLHLPGVQTWLGAEPVRAWQMFV